MRQVVLLLVTALTIGCGGNNASQQRYFSGEPVEHWLEAIKSPDPKARKKAVDVLGNVGPVDARAVPALIEAVKDRDARVRDAAVLALSKIGKPAASAVPALEEAAKDKDATIRGHAVTALEQIRGVR